jgi:hypothetical protein
MVDTGGLPQSFRKEVFFSGVPETDKRSGGPGKEAAVTNAL